MHSPLHAQRQLLACWLGLALASSVLSHEPERMEETVVVGKRSDLIGVAQAATEGSASGDELRARPILRRGEVLETVPGMVVTQHAGGGKANQYFLRGFNLDHGTDFAISLDGMPVNMRTHAHGQGYADLNLMIPELIEQVDYFKGTYAARNGDLSSAGSADFRYIDRLSRGFASFETGAYNFYRGVFGHTFDIGKPDAEKAGATSALTIAGEFTSYDGPWALPEDFSRWNGFVRYFSGTKDDHLSLTFLAYAGNWTSTDQIPNRAVFDGRLDRFGFVDPTNGGDSQRYSLQFHWQQSDGRATTALNLYGIYYDLDLFSNFTYALDDPDLGDQFEQTERRFVVGGDFSRKWHDVEFLNAPTTFTLGLQTRTDFIDDIGLHRTSQRQRTATVREDDVTEISAGIYGEALTKWSPWLRTSIGLRADAFSFDVNSDNAANTGDDLAGIVSPKFTAILGPWRDTEFYLSFGSGFHSNDARGVTTTVDPGTGGPVPAVDPLVRTLGAEIGLRTQIIPKVTATASLWWLDSDSELIYIGDAGTNEAGPASRRFGLETAVYWTPADWLTFDTELALTQARLRDNAAGDRIPYSVPWMLSGGFVLGAQGRQPGWFTGARVRAFSQRPLTEDNSVKGRATFTVNANIGYRTEKWEAALECLNLLDRRDNDIEYFYTSRLAGEPAGGFDDIHFHPAEPRMLRARFTYRW